MPSVVATPMASTSHSSCVSPSPRTSPAELHRDEVLRQALHQQQGDAAEQTHDRQQHLVRPPAGEDLREVRQPQRDQIDRQPLRRVQREPAGHARAQGDAADDEGHRRDREETCLGPPGARTDRAEDGRQLEASRGPARAGHDGRARSSRMRT